MDFLEKIRAIVYLNKLNSKVNLPELSVAIDKLSGEWGIDLNNPNSTTPKNLFAKTYRSMSKEEVAEYSQIKRTLRRYHDGNKK